MGALRVDIAHVSGAGPEGMASAVKHRGAEVDKEQGGDRRRNTEDQNFLRGGNKPGAHAKS